MISGFPALFWDVTQRMVVIIEVSGQLSGRIVQGQNSYISNCVRRWQHELGIIVDIKESINIDGSTLPSVVNHR
jgi:hypothetical protein